MMQQNFVNFSGLEFEMHTYRPLLESCDMSVWPKPASVCVGPNNHSQIYSWGLWMLIEYRKCDVVFRVWMDLHTDKSRCMGTWAVDNQSLPHFWVQINCGHILIFCLGFLSWYMQQLQKLWLWCYYTDQPTFWQNRKSIFISHMQLLFITFLLSLYHWYIHWPHDAVFTLQKWPFNCGRLAEGT